MNTFKSKIDSLDVSSRRKRRKAVVLVIDMLEKIRFAEEVYRDRIPLDSEDNQALINADYSIDSIVHAIVNLLHAY